MRTLTPNRKEKQIISKYAGDHIVEQTNYEGSSTACDAPDRIHVGWLIAKICAPIVGGKPVDTRPKHA